MMASREKILAAVRAGQAGVPKPAPLPDEGPGPLIPELAVRFAAEARVSDAEVFVESDRAGVVARVRTLIQGESVLAWDLGGLNVELGLKEPGAQPTLGLTACQGAIADTGSLVLVAGPGCPRTASLVVRTHVALVDPTDILPDLPAALKKIEGLGARAAHVNIITGPSRTADIEMTLTKGVHGPKRLVIVLGPWRESL